MEISGELYLKKQIWIQKYQILLKKSYKYKIKFNEAYT